jgi:hypothetical protein
MRHAVVESGRKSCGVRLDIFRDRLWRATDRDTVRNIAIDMRGKENCSVQQLQLLLRVPELGAANW